MAIRQMSHRQAGCHAPVRFADAGTQTTKKPVPKAPISYLKGNPQEPWSRYNTALPLLLLQPKQGWNGAGPVMVDPNPPRDSHWSSPQTTERRSYHHATYSHGGSPSTICLFRKS